MDSLNEILLCKESRRYSEKKMRSGYILPVSLGKYLSLFSIALTKEDTLYASLKYDSCFIKTRKPSRLLINPAEQPINLSDTDSHSIVSIQRYNVHNVQDD